MRHPLVLWTLLLLAAGLSWWLGGGGQRPSPVATHQGPREVDYYLRDFNATRMGPDGRPDRTLSARELRHFPDDDTTELAQPVLDIHQGEAPPWVVRSERGWVSANGDLILLQGAVHIERAAGPRNRPMRIDTRNLRVQPRQDYAETDERVRVRSGRDRIDATGMQAWFRAPARIKFLADVKGYYAPP
jgi:lipopolysaccharide export system protein LptC